MTKKNKNIVITGEWDGEPIWRRKTAQEILAEAYAELEADTKRQKK